MQPVLNVEDIKKVEHSLANVGVSISELMHRAGVAAAREVLQLGSIHHACVLCGFGNNAGDGWVAAEYLVSKGVDVTVVTPVGQDELQGDLLRVCAKSAEAHGVTVYVAPPKDELEQLLCQQDVIIDAIFGTGFHGRVREPFSLWIECINASSAVVVSIDVPSGLSAQTGHTEGACVRARLTITMLALKPGLIADEGRDVCGAIVVAPLAEQTEYLVQEADPVAWRCDIEDYDGVYPELSSACNKFTRGSVLVVGGSARYPGACVLAARAAARSGAGYVTLAVPHCIAGLVQSQVCDIPVLGLPSGDDGMFDAPATQLISSLAKKASCVLVGPGMRVNAHTIAIVASLLESAAPLVVDADGLNCIARLTDNALHRFPELIRRNQPLILTPHQKELARLTGSDEACSTLSATLDAARKIVWTDGGSELVVMAKSSATACVSADVALLPKPGPAALATAGSGDVLAGIITSLLSQAPIAFDDLVRLCALACEVHGKAAQLAQRRYGMRGIMAHDLIDEIGLAAQSFYQEHEHDGMAAGYAAANDEAKVNN